MGRGLTFVLTRDYRCSHLEHKLYLKKIFFLIPESPFGPKKEKRQTGNLWGDDTFLAGIELSRITVSRLQPGNVHQGPVGDLGAINCESSPPCFLGLLAAAREDSGGRMQGATVSRRPLFCAELFAASESPPAPTNQVQTVFVCLFLGFWGAFF